MSGLKDVFSNPKKALNPLSYFAGLDEVGNEISKALTPKPPELPGAVEPLMAPTPMPVASPDDAAMQAAKRKSLAQQIARRGRASTILTQPVGQESLGATQ